MKISKLTDRFNIKLEGVTVIVAPLSGSQKIEMTSFYKQGENGRILIDKPAQELYLVKHSVKEIEGIRDLDGNAYQLEFDRNGFLTNDCAEEVLGYLANTFYTYANTQAIRGLFGEVLNPYTGEKLEGVSVERLVKQEDEKK